jgi:hypothetical protein
LPARVTAAFGREHPHDNTGDVLKMLCRSCARRSGDNDTILTGNEFRTRTDIEGESLPDVVSCIFGT